jgi:PTS system glucitol/sorbitol-specific IIA component
MGGDRELAAGEPAVRYETEVTEVGAEVAAFVEAGVLVWFDDTAPEELRWFSVLHRPTVTVGGVEPGDVVHIDDRAMLVTAVGEVANANLVALGHLDLKANGAVEPPMPGDVCVEQTELPEIRPGTRLRIVAGEAGEAGEAAAPGAGHDASREGST